MFSTISIARWWGHVFGRYGELRIGGEQHQGRTMTRGVGRACSRLRSRSRRWRLAGRHTCLWDIVCVPAKENGVDVGVIPTPTESGSGRGTGQRLQLVSSERAWQVKTLLTCSSPAGSWSPGTRCCAQGTPGCDGVPTPSSRSSLACAAYSR
eukprot:scaffold830_cov377-Prasinococcus_capsulatus_cf.AAC.23